MLLNKWMWSLKNSSENIYNMNNFQKYLRCLSVIQATVSRDYVSLFIPAPRRVGNALGCISSSENPNRNPYRTQ